MPGTSSGHAVLFMEPVLFQNDTAHLLKCLLPKNFIPQENENRDAFLDIPVFVFLLPRRISTTQYRAETPPCKTFQT